MATKSRLSLGLVLALLYVLFISTAIHAFSPRLVVESPSQSSLQRGLLATPIQCTVNVVRLNLRSGPGTQYTTIEAMTRNTIFTATERFGDGAWVYGTSPTASGWTAARFLRCATNVTTLAVTTQLTQTVNTSTVASPAAAPTLPVTTTVTAPASQPAAPAANSGSAFTLIKPLEARFRGRQTFQWQTQTPLAANQAYELVFWEPGQDPLSQGFSILGGKPESTVQADLDKLSTILPQLQLGKEYQWGVLLVQMRPYRRLQYLGGGHRFVFSGIEAQSGDSGGSTSAEEAPPPPPKAPPK